MRDKLIELIDDNKACPFDDLACCECEYSDITPCFAGRMADALIAHGVTFADVPETNVGKWIPVSERLPAKEGVYIVRSETGAAYTSHFYSEKTFASGYCRPSGWTPRGKVKVTHWMPLPLVAPKEGE